MSDELIDSYIDRAAIADDTKYFADQLKGIIDILDKLQGTKLTLSGAGSMQDIAGGANTAKAALDELAASKDKLTKSDLLAAKAAKATASAQLDEAKAAQLSAKSSQEKAKADVLAAKAAKDQAAAEKLLAQARKENAQAAATEQKTANGTARAKEKQQLDEIGKAYQEYSKAAREASLRAKAYAFALGEGDPRTKAAIQQAKEMNDNLARVDSSVGQYGRNVGNYKSGWDGLGQSFTQISRELPSLTISVSQFALAISNNLPMLADEIGKAKTEIAALKAEGKDAPSLFSRIAGAAFSFQVALSVGIALITAYAGQIATWVSALVKGNGTVIDAAKKQEMLNEVMKETESEFTRAATSASELKEQIQLAKEGFLEKEQVIKAYNDSIGKTTGTVKSLQEAEEELTKKGDAYITMTLKKAVANIALEKAAKKAFEAEEVRRKKQEEFNSVLDNPTGGSVISTPGSGSFNAAEFDRQQKQQKEFAAKRKQDAIDAKNAEAKVYTDIADDASRQAAEIAKRFGLNFYGDNAIVQRTAQQKKFRDTAINDDAEMYKALADNQDALLSFRISAREKQAKLELSVLEGQKQAELANLEDEQNIQRERASIGEVSKAELAQSESDYQRKRGELIADYNEKEIHLERVRANSIVEIRATSSAKLLEQQQQDQEEALKAAQEADEKLLASRTDAVQNEVARRQKNSAEGQQAEIAALNKSYAAATAATKAGTREREKVDREFSERRADIEQSYAEAELKNQIYFAENYIKIRKDAGENVTEKETELSKLRMQLSDLETKHTLDNNARQAKDYQEAFEARKRGIETFGKVYNETTTFIDGLVSANIDKQKNAIQVQIDDIDRKKQADIDAINASSANTQEKAAQTALVEAKAAAQKEQLQKKQAQLDQQRAKFEKAITVGRIIADTAAAVVAALGAKPWTPLNIASAAAVGAIGAGRLAVALATPIPKFRDGREGGAETFAIVGDGGKREVVTSPDLSQAYVTPNTDTLTYLKKDWKVFPDVEAFKLAASGMGTPQLAVLPMVNNDNGTSQVIARLSSEMNSLKQTVKNKQEVHMYWKDGEMRKAVKRANDWIKYEQNNL